MGMLPIVWFIEQFIDCGCDLETTWFTGDYDAPLKNGFFPGMYHGIYGMYNGMYGIYRI